MKPIRALDGPTPGLANYLACEEQPNWQEFRSHQAGASYRELIEALAARQHGLCGYCEIDLQDKDRQVEHFAPQSGAPGQALDAGNLIAACTGGASARFGPNRSIRDEDRFLLPPKRNLSCGAAKGDHAGGKLIDPRTLPEAPIFNVSNDGELQANGKTGEMVGIATDRVEHTIDLLGLNVPRLRQARKRFLEDLEREMEFVASKGKEATRQWIRTLLSPNAGGNLNRFFTTTRSYFGELAEQVLDSSSVDWA